jgi:hypothetical protein
MTFFFEKEKKKLQMTFSHCHPELVSGSPFHENLENLMATLNPKWIDLNALRFDDLGC